MESPKITISPHEETFSSRSEEEFGKEKTSVMEYSDNSTSPQDESLLPKGDIVTEPEEPYAIDSTADSDVEKETYPQSPRETIPSAMEEDYTMEYNKDNTSPPNQPFQPEEDIPIVTENKDTYAMHSDNDNNSDNESISPVRAVQDVTKTSPVLKSNDEDSNSREELSSSRDDFLTGQASAAEEALVDNDMPTTPDMGGTRFEDNASPVISEREQPSPIETDHSVPETTYPMEDPFVDVPSAESPTVAERTAPTLRETAPSTNTTPVKQRTPARKRTPYTPKNPVRVKTPARERTSPLAERTPAAPPKIPVLAPQVTDKQSRLERARAVRESREARLKEKGGEMEKTLATTGKGAITKMRESFTKLRDNFRAELHDLRSYQPSSDADEPSPNADEAPNKAAVSVIFLLGSYIFLLVTICGLAATSVFPFLNRFVF
ncbi:hypothetical protein SMACR_05154 [Sordaria macrospora]|uniref:WGS project CABT00000000 data, contig 2.22 n=2 Tax=Sordaria macrospora TaxID=5147 RepID=F7W2T9_SORMK|nr:uncharacterized protein SMAC_05154 [Sordaria macrospora k-hell]KAA8631824.1 hypothetical protein SMACR_05154 [Sordaria macrospora]WPJ61045.1 hypothetical protein SMAC4_05154 [Sordaria macrospora]CCC11940.1 unnamed protein product [Sordaria macrospora k-hell]